MARKRLNSSLSGALVKALAGCCGNDCGYAFNYIRRAGDQMVATDGHILTKIEVCAADGEEAYYDSALAGKIFRANDKITANGELQADTGASVLATDNTPRWPVKAIDIIFGCAPGETRTLSVKLLDRLLAVAKAAGEQHINVSFGGRKEPVILRGAAYKFDAAIMPVNLEE